MSRDSAIDVNGTMTLTGGVLVSLGSSQMAQVPDSDSQAVLAASVDGAQGRAGRLPARRFGPHAGVLYAVAVVGSMRSSACRR